MGRAAAAGVASGMLVLALAHIFRKRDRESGLPPPSCLWFFLAGILSCAAVAAGAGMAGSILLFSYLAFSAYTDWHTMYLYTAVNRVYLSGGLILLALEGYSQKCLGTAVSAMGLYVLWVLFCYLVHAISSGDVELLAAVSAWSLASVLPALPTGQEFSVLEAAALPAAVQMTGSILAFVCNIRDYIKKQKKRTAFAPYVLGGSSLVVLWIYFM